MFDKRQLKEAYKTLKIGSDWIRLDQMTWGWFEDRPAWGWLKDDLGLSRSTLDNLAPCLYLIYLSLSLIIKDRWISRTCKLQLHAASFCKVFINILINNSANTLFTNPITCLLNQQVVFISNQAWLYTVGF